MLALMACLSVEAASGADAVRLVDVFPGDGPDDELNQYPSGAAVIDGIAYFSLFDAEHGRELWRSDGTPGGTRRVRDLAPGPASSSPEALTAIGRTLYFGASDPELGCRLWRSDGTAGGTRPLATFQDGPLGCFNTFAPEYYDGPRHFTAVGARVFFTARDAEHGQELWRTDGTARGTSLVRNIAADPVDGPSDSRPRGLAAVGDQLLFIAWDQAHGDELWRSDGTANGTALVRDIGPGTYGGLLASSELAVTDGVAVFAAGDVYGYEPWRSDGSEAGTYRLADLSAGVFNSMLGPDILALPVLAVDGAVYLWAHGGAPARPSVWRTDGSAAPQLVGDLPPGNLRVRPVAAGAAAYFAWSDVAGAGIWRADAAGTAFARVIPRAPLGSPIGGFLAVGDLLVFLAHDAVHGCALWRSDGTAAGTGVVADVNPAAFDCSDSSGLWTAATAEHVLFEGNDGITGVEPWALPIEALAVTPACAGDCDGNAQVGIEELVRGVGIALGGTPTVTCPAFDADGDNAVSIAELITAVSAALGGC